MGTLAKLFTNLSISRHLIVRNPVFLGTNQQFVRKFIYDDKLKPGKGVGGGNQFRRKVGENIEIISQFDFYLKLKLLLPDSFSRRQTIHNRAFR